MFLEKLKRRGVTQRERALNDELLCRADFLELPRGFDAADGRRFDQHVLAVFECRLRDGIEKFRRRRHDHRFDIGAVEQLPIIRKSFKAISRFGGTGSFLAAGGDRRQPQFRNRVERRNVNVLDVKAGTDQTD